MTPCIRIFCAVTSYGMVSSMHLVDHMTCLTSDSFHILVNGTQTHHFTSYWDGYYQSNEDGTKYLKSTII